MEISWNIVKSHETSWNTNGLWKTLTIFDPTDPVPHVFRLLVPLSFDPNCSTISAHDAMIWSRMLLLKHHLAKKKRPAGKNVATSAAKHSKTHKFRYPQTSPDIPRPTNPWIKTHQMAWPMETPWCAACKVSSANKTSRPFRVVTWSHCHYLPVYTDNTLSSISPLCFLLWTSKVTSQAFPNLTCLVVCQYPEQFQVWWDKGKFIYWIV